MGHNNFKIFDCFSKNLAYIDSAYNGLYACPICLHLFNKSHLGNEFLTLEHIIPKQLGGKIVTLTCKSCNNESGTKIDDHLIKKIRSDEVMSGKSLRPLKSEIKIGDGQARGDLYIQVIEGKAQLDFIVKPNLAHPKEIEKCQAALNDDIGEIKLSGCLEYKEHNFKVALLRVAYLLMFSRLGYGYILSEPMKIIRSQIQKPEQILLNPVIINTTFESENSIEAIYIYDPIKYRCFGAIMKLSELTNQSLMVALPGISGRNSDATTLFEGYSGKKETLKPIIIPYNLAQLSDKEFLSFPNALWKGTFDDYFKGSYC